MFKEEVWNYMSTSNRWWINWSPRREVIRLRKLQPKKREKSADQLGCSFVISLGERTIIFQPTYIASIKSSYPYIFANYMQDFTKFPEFYANWSAFLQLSEVSCNSSMMPWYFRQKSLVIMIVQNPGAKWNENMQKLNYKGLLDGFIDLETTYHTVGIL